MAPNPVVTKGLTQVTMGAPQTVYNGGLLRALVRYFDGDRMRPGLPEDVAALVDRIEAEQVGIQLVNLHSSETRNVVIQAGAFGEHHFKNVNYQQGSSNNPVEVSVDARHFAIQLPPSATIRLDVSLRRFVNDPTYALPWSTS